MRVLAPGGTLVKVIPGNDYLAELRQQALPFESGKQTYSEWTSQNAMQSECPQVTFEEVRYTVDLTEETYRHLLRNDAFILGSKCRR